MGKELDLAAIRGRTVEGMALASDLLTLADALENAWAENEDRKRRVGETPSDGCPSLTGEEAALLGEIIERHCPEQEVQPVEYALCERLLSFVVGAPVTPDDYIFPCGSLVSLGKKREGTLPLSPAERVIALRYMECDYAEWKPVIALWKHLQEGRCPPLDVTWDDLPDPPVTVLKRRVAELEARERELLAMPLTLDREALGRKVREVWVGWAQSQSTTRAPRVTPWEELPEAIREGDRRVGEAIAAPFLRAASELLAIAERATQRDRAERTPSRDEERDALVTRISAFCAGSGLPEAERACLTRLMLAAVGVAAQGVDCPPLEAPRGLPPLVEEAIRLEVLRQRRGAVEERRVRGTGGESP